MQITSNMSADEVISLFGDSMPPAILKLVDSLQDKIKELEDELEKETKAKELVDEQNYFATELIGNLREGLNQTTRLNEYRKTFDKMISDSLFEM
jgi:vacuolar-type H+-ATPase subunit I/STV1